MPPAQPPPAPPSVLRMVQCEPASHSRTLKRVRLDVTTGVAPAYSTPAPAPAFGSSTRPTQGFAAFAPSTPSTPPMSGLGSVFEPPCSSPAPPMQAFAALAGAGTRALASPNAGSWPVLSHARLKTREPGDALSDSGASTSTAGPSSRGLEGEPRPADDDEGGDDDDDDDDGVPILRDTLPPPLPLLPFAPDDALSGLTEEELAEIEMDHDAAEDETGSIPPAGAATPREGEAVSDDEDEGAVRVPPPSDTPPLRLIASPSDVPPPPAPDAALLQEAHDILEADSHRVRRDLAARSQTDTSTAARYDAIVRNYSQWWSGYQADLLAQRKIQVAVPAFPITATRVTFFLEHEMSREKRKRGSKESIPGSSLGKYHIAGVISALENRRLNDEYRYRDVPEAQRGLRLDKRIKDAERFSRHNEPKRARTANTLKASGTSSDAYMPAELQQCALWCVSEAKTALELFRGVRDRAMLLVSASTAFRGDSARMVQWSDLFISEVPLPEVRPDYLLPVLGVYSDNAKHNQQGRVDEFGMIRHRIVELCPIGAAALLFWTHFHVLECPPPDFVPDFTDKEYGQFGRRDWYNTHLFYATEVNKQMSYDTHYSRIKRIHEACGVSLTKVTHAPRHFAAQNARNHGASVNGAKAMGGWSDSGSYRACYDRTFPLDALLASAMFNGRDPSSYFLARDTLDPPQDLLLGVFPWVEEQERALLARRSAHRFATDIALYQFLRVLKWFRRVLLQDTAVLFCRYPSLPMFRYAPFNGARFQEYAKGASDTIAAAELRARCAFENVPVNLVAGMQALITESYLARERDAANVKAYHERVMQRVDALELAVVSQKKPTRTSRKTRAATAADTAAPTASAAPVPPAVPLASAAVAAATAMPLPSLSPGMPPAAHPAFLHPAAVPSPPASVYGLALPASAQWLPSNPIPTPATTTDARAQKRDQLLQIYGEDRIARHEWRLVDNQFVPFYTLQAVKTISDIWTEYTLGLNRFLPVRELEENWGPKWRMNVSGIKTEWSRRKPVIGIIAELADKPRWSVDLALRFLQTEYRSYSARKFYEYIKKAENRREVIERSNSFP